MGGGALLPGRLLTGGQEVFSRTPTPPPAGHRHSMTCSSLKTEDREGESFPQTVVWYIIGINISL